MFDHLFHVHSCVAEVLARVEVVGVLDEVLSDCRRERYAKVGVDIDLADRKLRRFSKLRFGNADRVGHGAAELVDDRNLLLRNARRAVKNDGEAGKAFPISSRLSIRSLGS